MLNGKPRILPMLTPLIQLTWLNNTELGRKYILAAEQENSKIGCGVLIPSLTVIYWSAQQD